MGRISVVGAALAVTVTLLTSMAISTAIFGGSGQGKPVMESQSQSTALTVVPRSTLQCTSSEGTEGRSSEPSIFFLRSPEAPQSPEAALERAQRNSGENIFGERLRAATFERVEYVEHPGGGVSATFVGRDQTGRVNALVSVGGGRKGLGYLATDQTVCVPFSDKITSVAGSVRENSSSAKRAG